MSKAEETKQYIIESSSVVFNKKGYAGTSLADIMNATSLTKGAIYGNFENKDEVAIAVYNYNFQALRKRIAQMVKEQDSAYKKLMAFIGYYRTNWKQVFERGGCPIQNASIEADDNLTFLKKHVQDSIKVWIKDLTYVIKEGQTNKEFKAAINASDYAYEIITILEGGIMLSKIMNNQHLLFSSLERINIIIDQEIKK